MPWILWDSPVEVRPRKGGRGSGISDTAKRAETRSGPRKLQHNGTLPRKYPSAFAAPDTSWVRAAGCVKSRRGETVPGCAPILRPEAGTFHPGRLPGRNPADRLRARVSARVGVASLWVAVLGRAGCPLAPAPRRSPGVVGCHVPVCRSSQARGVH